MIRGLENWLMVPDESRLGNSLFGSQGNSLFGSQGNSLFGSQGNSLFGSQGMANASIQGYGAQLSNAYRVYDPTNGIPARPTPMRRYRGSRYDDGKHTGRRFGNQE